MDTLIYVMDSDCPILITKLYADHVINEADKQRIEVQPTCMRKNVVLLDALLRKLHASYSRFLEALKDKRIGQEHIAVQLEGLEIDGLLNTFPRRYVDSTEEYSY
jgi:hypothetical protein